MSAYFKYMCYELEMTSCYLISNVEAVSSLRLTLQTELSFVWPWPLPGEPFHGQLLPEGRSQEAGEEKERTEEKEGLHGGAPEIFTSESAQTFSARHPDRFSSHWPGNLVLSAPQPPRRSRDHNWKQLGTTECSTTCGKGEVWAGRASVNQETGVVCWGGSGQGAGRGRDISLPCNGSLV